MNNKIIYFELNNWFCGRDYPNAEPFISWMSDDDNLKFNNDAWCKENKLCVAKTFIDMSTNFCIAASKQWVEEKCPDLLTKFKDFLRVPDKNGNVYGNFGSKFMDYCEHNYGCTFLSEDSDHLHRKK